MSGFDSEANDEEQHISRHAQAGIAVAGGPVGCATRRAGTAFSSRNRPNDTDFPAAADERNLRIL